MAECPHCVQRGSPHLDLALEDEMVFQRVLHSLIQIEAHCSAVHLKRIDEVLCKPGSGSAVDREDSADTGSEPIVDYVVVRGDEIVVGPDVSASVGPHFHPNKMKHGAPGDQICHAGDLGNIVANAYGVAEATIVDNQIPLIGPNLVVGRALVVHELEDDLGKGGKELSLSTGNAGGRLACGVVGLTPE
nr:superoxide dismutase [Cu-Zn], chloroplastic-like [Arachis hypogaea]